MRQPRLQQPIHPRTCDSTQQRNYHNGCAAADLCKQRTGTSTCNSPANTKNNSSIYETSMVRFWNDPDRFVVDGLDPELFYQLKTYHSGNYCRTNNSVHMETLQPEHFLYPEPRYYFSFDNENSEQ